MLKKLTIVFVIALFVCVTSGYLLINYHLKKPLNVQSPQFLIVENGLSFTAFTQKLVDNRWIDNNFWLKVHTKLNSDLSKIKVGTYSISPNTSVIELLEKIVAGKEHQFKITFIEGSTLKQWLELLKNHPRVKHTLAEVNEENQIKYKEVATKLNLNFEYPEGVFFPETYAFINQTSDVAILQRAYEKMQQILNDAWKNRANDLPYSTPYQALIMASIIEKESGLYTEHALISSVFVNRLNIGMRLQTDPTIIYGLGSRYKGDIKREHKREKTAYNTYRINGLPPTPIAMPSKASLIATLNPESSEYLYFVSNGAGKHIFSTNLADHNKAVVKYQLNR